MDRIINQICLRKISFCVRRHITEADAENRGSLCDLQTALPNVQPSVARVILQFRLSRIFFVFRCDRFFRQDRHKTGVHFFKDNSACFCRTQCQNRRQNRNEQWKSDLSDPKYPVFLSLFLKLTEKPPEKDTCRQRYDPGPGIRQYKIDKLDHDRKQTDPFLPSFFCSHDQVNCQQNRSDRDRAAVVRIVVDPPESSPFQTDHFC